MKKRSVLAGVLGVVFAFCACSGAAGSGSASASVSSSATGDGVVSEAGISGAPSAEGASSEIMAASSAVINSTSIPYRFVPGISIDGHHRDLVLEGYEAGYMQYYAKTNGDRGVAFEDAAFIPELGEENTGGLHFDSENNRLECRFEIGIAINVGAIAGPKLRYALELSTGEIVDKEVESLDSGEVREGSDRDFPEMSDERLKEIAELLFSIVQMEDAKEE